MTSSRSFLHGIQPSFIQRGGSDSIARRPKSPSSSSKSKIQPNPFTPCSKAPETPCAMLNDQIKTPNVGISKSSQTHQNTACNAAVPLCKNQIREREKKTKSNRNIIHQYLLDGFTGIRAANCFGGVVGLPALLPCDCGVLEFSIASKPGLTKIFHLAVFLMSSVVLLLCIAIGGGFSRRP